MSDDRKTLDEKISEALDVEPTPTENLPAEVDTNNEVSTEIIECDEQADNDFEETRETLKDLEKTGLDAIDYLMTIAKETETSRPFEVLSNLIKTTAEVSKDKLNIHETKRKLKNNTEENSNNSGMNIQNANIVVGTTKDIMKKIKDE